MKELVLCKYGEFLSRAPTVLILKSSFGIYSKNAQRPMAVFGSIPCKAPCISSRKMRKPTFRALTRRQKHIWYFRRYPCPANGQKYGVHLETARTSFLPYLDGARTFKVEAKRADKGFPLTSPEISAEVGGAILEASHGRLRVDVHHPDICVRVEIRDLFAYLCAGQEHAIGGMPQGSGGRGLLLLSGGIDSPVAGFMMAKRGVKIDALHFESFPYTSERARKKVLSLAEKLTDYLGEIHVHILSVTHIQEALREACEEDYFTLLLRRFMMRLAERTARKIGCEALITGESLGQVASQTMQAIGVTNCVVTLPVFRPLIGMDKEEIVRISRAIDTFETSILPYEDCCTVFTPRHPKTRPELMKVEREETKIDVAALEDEAFDTLETVVIGRS